MTASGVVLSLDLATVTGWAVGLPVASPTALEAAADKPPQPQSGVESFQQHSGDVGDIFLAFDTWLNGMLAVHQPKMIIFEEPILHHKSGYSARLALGIAAIAELKCLQNHIGVYVVPTGTLKKHATGRGNAKKWQMKEAARQRGWTFKDDNECDALWIFDWACAHLISQKAA